MRVITRQHDTLDLICHRHYGRVDVIPLVLEANRHLANHTPILPDGLSVHLPDLGRTPAAPVIRLWS